MSFLWFESLLTFFRIRSRSPFHQGTSLCSFLVFRGQLSSYYAVIIALDSASTAWSRSHEFARRVKISSSCSKREALYLTQFVVCGIHTLREWIFPNPSLKDMCQYSEFDGSDDTCQDIIEEDSGVEQIVKSSTSSLPAPSCL